MIMISKHLKSVDAKEEGLLVLGSQKITQEEAKLNFKKRYQKKYNLALYAIFGVLFAIGCFLLIWAILTDQLGDLIYTVGGGL